MMYADAALRRGNGGIGPNDLSGGWQIMLKIKARVSAISLVPLLA